MDKWIWKQFKQIQYITIPEWLEQGINIGFSARHGGESGKPFDSLNMGLHVGDRQERVIRNRHQLMHVFNISLDKMVCCQQVHGSSAACINEKHAGLGAEDLDTSLPGIDAMITKTPGLMLTAFYADCIPILFFDPVKRVVALAHSGWKGTMGRIVSNTVQTMVQSSKSNPGDIEVFIGPGIGSCCFQIQPDLSEKVIKAFPEFDVIMYRNEECFWDLRLTNRNLLIDAGIDSEKIIDCDLCTSCRTDLFYSHRRENGKTGRMAAVIGIQAPR